MEQTKLPGNERNWELHPACSAKLLHLMCFSFQWLGVLCPSWIHFSWVPVCNVRAIWKMADNANKTHCLSKTSLCSFSHAGPEHPELALVYVWCRAHLVVWCTMAISLQPPWENHGLHESHEKNVTIISKAPGGCTIGLLGSDQIQSCHASTSTFRFSSLIYGSKWSSKKNSVYFLHYCLILTLQILQLLDSLKNRDDWTLYSIKSNSGFSSLFETSLTRASGNQFVKYFRK